MRITKLWRLGVCGLLTFLGGMAAHALPDESYVTQAGLQLWLKADSLGLTSGAFVDQWSDSSGNANHATPVASGNRPKYIGSILNGKPVVRFDATATTKQYLNVADVPGLMPTDQVTLIAVASRTTGGGTGAMMVMEKGYTGDPYLGYSLRFPTTASAGFYLNGDSAVGATVLDAYHILAGVYDGVNNTLYVNSSNGVASPYTSAIAPRGTPLSIGCRLAAGTLSPVNNIQGDIAELLVYGRAISAAERRDIEAYLYTKYNSGTSLGNGPVALAPVFSVKTGTYAEKQIVALSCPDMPGAIIRYTLDGITDPTLSSTPYSSESPIEITGYTKIKARAFKAGYRQPTNPAEAVITIDANTVHVPRNGLQVWLRADSPGIGGSITTWWDQSGNANHATATGTPIYSASGPVGSLGTKPAVTFAAGQYFSIPHTAALQAAQMSAFVVSKRASGTTTAVVLEKFVSSSNAGYSLQMPNATSFRHYVGSTSATASIVGSTPRYVLSEAIFDQVNVSLCLDRGTAVNSARTTEVPDNTQPVYIGGRAAASTHVGDIAEVLLYDRGLSAAERSDIEAYMNYKYGIGTTAPVLAAPQFNLQDGLYGTKQEVRISGPAGAEIKYSINGGGLQNYTGAIEVSNSAVITAYATKLHYANSTVATLNLEISSSVAYVSNDKRELWLRASSLSGLADNTPVDEWKDQSGKGNHARKSTDATRPKFALNGISSGKHTVRFAPADLSHLLVSNVPGLNPQKITIFAIAKRGALSSTRDSIIDKGSDITGYTLRFGNGSATAVATVNSFDDVTQAIVTASFHTLCSVYDGKKLKLYVDAAETHEENEYEGVITPNSYSLSIGGRAAADTLDGEIAEILVYSRALSTDEVRKLEAYAYQEYGVGNKPRAESPVPSSGDGTIFATEKKLKLSATPGAIILYTLNSTTVTPALSDSFSGTPPSGWNAYTADSEVSVTSTSTYRAVALVAGHKTSKEAVLKLIRDDTAQEVIKLAPRLWLRADAVTPDGGNMISLWPDSSGNHFDVAQATAASQPSYVASQALIANRPTVAFNGSSTVLLATESRNLNLPKGSILAVVKGSSASGRDIIRDVEKSHIQAGGTGMTLQFDSSTRFKAVILGKNPAYIPGASADEYKEFKHSGRHSIRTADTFSILGGQWEAPFTSEAYSNYEKSMLGVEVGYGDAYLTSGALSVGASAANTYNLNGEIGEILVFDKVLSDIERIRVEAYLNNRYSIISSAARQAPPPRFSPPTGTYAKITDDKLKITSDVGANIYYTENGLDPFDGLAPRTGVAPNSGSVELIRSGAITIKARAATLLSGTFGQSTVPYAKSDMATLTVEPGTASVSRKGLKLWLKADSLTELSNGASLDRWEDQSGSENHAVQTNSELTPAFVLSGLNGKPTVRFGNGGTLKYMVVKDTGSLRPKQVSMVAIAKRSSGTSSAFLLRKGDGTDGYSLLMDGVDTVRSRINTSSETGALSSSEQTSFNVLIATFDQLLNRVYVNGALAASPTAQAVEVREFLDELIIGSATSSGNHFTGDIAEILVYDHALGDDERRGIHDYAYTKYRVGPQSTLQKPRFNLTDGKYSTVQSLTMTSPDEKPIRYTVDGSVPTAASALYTAPLSLAGSQTIRAIACESGFADSPVAVLRFAYSSVPGLPTDNGAPSAYQLDTDGDGVPDAIEGAIGSDPNNPASTGNGVGRTYQYDPIHQLTHDGVKTYNYDAEGNASRN